MTEETELPYYLPGTHIQLSGFSHLHDRSADPVNDITLYCSSGDRRSCPVCRQPFHALNVKPIENRVFEATYKVVIDPNRKIPTRFELGMTNTHSYIYIPCGCEVPITPANIPE